MAVGDIVPAQASAPARLNMAMLLADLGWLLVIGLTVLVRQLLQNQPVIVERAISGTLFQAISFPIALVTSLVPFSLTELLALLAILTLSGWLLWLLVRLTGRLTGRLTDRLSAPALPWQKGVLRRRARALLWTAAILALLFFLLHGVNYFRLPVAQSFGFAVRPRTAQELAVVTETLAREASAVRAQSLENANGVFRLRDGVRGTLDQTTLGYTAAAVEWPQLAGPTVRPKGVLVSHLWSYTGISGIYVPFLVEANVNIDQPDYVIPDTAGHEAAHAHGFAREDEAGFISFLANTHNPNPDIRYSALANAYVRCANALYAQDPEAYAKTARFVSAAMSRDLNENSRYWQQFAGPVATASEQVNNAYLKSNKQTDGVQSYGRMIDLVLAYSEKTGGLF